MTFSELHRAMQTGGVDGSGNTTSKIFTPKHQQVQKHLTISGHGYFGYLVITFKKFRDGLPADIRSILEGAMRDASGHANETAKKENDDTPEAIRIAGKTQLTTLTPAEKAVWQKTLVMVPQQSEEKIGQEWMQTICKATGYDPKQSSRRPAATGSIKENKRWTRRY